MQLEELKNIWQDYDSNLNAKINLNHALLKEVSINKIQNMLSSFKWSNVFELVISALFIPFLLNFVKATSTILPLFICGIFLLLLMIGTIIYNLYIIFQISEIRYDIPIVSAQKKLERIKLLEAREVNSLYILIPAFSIAFTALIAKFFLNLNLFDYLNLFWGTQFLGTILVTFIIVYLLKKFPNKELESALDFIKEMEDLEDKK